MNRRLGLALLSLALTIGEQSLGSAIRASELPPAIGKTELLVESLRSMDPNVQELAIRELEKELGGNGVLPYTAFGALGPLLSSDRLEIRLGAMGLVQRLPREQQELALPQLADLATANDPDIRARVAKELGELRTDTTPQLMALLGDADAGTRYAALEALKAAYSDAKPFLGPLNKALQDDNTWVRDQALRTVASFGKSARSLLPRLFNALEDRRHIDSTQYEAALALGAILEYSPPPTGPAALFGPEPDPPLPQESIARIVASLGKLLAEDDSALREAALGAIGKMRLSETVPLLKSAFDDSSAKVRLAAVAAARANGLIALGVRRQVLGLLQDQNREVRYGAAEYLVDFGLPQDEQISVPSSLLLDPHPTVTDVAHRLEKQVEALHASSRRHEKAAESQSAVEDFTGGELDTLAADGQEVAFHPSANMLVFAVTSWCPHSRALVETLSDPEIARYLKSKQIYFAVANEPPTEDAEPPGEATPSDGHAEPHYADPGWIAALPGITLRLPVESMPESVPAAFNGWSFEPAGDYLIQEDLVPAELLRATAEHYEQLRNEDE